MRQGKLIALFLCLALLLTGTTVAQAGEKQENIIEVSGEGIVDAVPDRAELLLAVVTEAPDAGRARDENSERSDRVIKALKEQGIPAEDIQTQNYHLSPKYSQPGKPVVLPVPAGEPGREEAPKIVGYTVHHQIRVKIRELDRVGELMDLAVQNGANQITNVSFTVSDSLEYKKQALQEAVAEARAKAEVLAAALGKTLEDIKSASGSWNETYSGPAYYREMVRGAGDGDGAGATPVSPGMVQVRANVNITYSIN